MLVENGYLYDVYFQLTRTGAFSRFFRVDQGLNSWIKLAKQRYEIKTSGFVSTLCQSHAKYCKLHMHKLKLPLKSSPSFHNFCISRSFWSVSSALYTLLAPRKMSSPVDCRFNRKLLSNGLKLSLFDLSFNCWRVCKKMQILGSKHANQ